MGEFLTEGRRPQRFQSESPGGVNIATLTGNLTLTDKSSQIQVLDPGGSSRDVTLPAARDGMWWMFSNTADADEDLVIKDAAGGTLLTINQGEQGMVAVDGTTYGVVYDTQVDLSSIKVDTIDESTPGAGVTVDGLLLKDGAVQPTSGTGTGKIVNKSGTSATEGYEERIFEDTFSPVAISTAVVTLPAGHTVMGTWMQVATTLTGGGTTATVSLGIAADVDELGTLASDDYTTQGDLLVADSKWTALASATPLTGRGDALGLFSEVARAVVVSGAAAGGATAGDTALTVGSIRIRIHYRVALPLDDE